MDLSGTQIGGLLRLGSLSRGSAHWPKNSFLSVRIAKAEAVQGLRDSWPDKLDLTGFTYRSLIFATDNDATTERETKWFKTWLNKQTPYAPEPYQQLAAVLRNEGHPDTADEVLYAGKERERVQSPFLSYVTLTASKWFIGYGYHLFRSVYWILGFVGVGTLALWISGEGRRISRHYNFLYGVVYNCDLLLPIIKLRDKHYDIDLHGWIRYYFYVHKLMGYVLAGFLAAGLSGLIK